jgi:flavin reductase (DIM6/NTAB) family NADH-FMN oxidoreductase RutF
MHSSHYSNRAVKTSKKLSVNIIDEKFVAQADYTGTVSGAQTDKSRAFDFHLGENGTPVIEDSPLVMECEVVDTYKIDGFDNFICSVKNTYIEDDLLTENGKIDYDKLKPVLFEMPTYKYLRTGDVIGDCVKIGKAYGADMKD